MVIHNWIAIYYNKKDKVICKEKFFDRTEDEAESEAIGLMPKNCHDWSLIPLLKLKDFKLSIDAESVNIYFDNGEDKEPTHIVYWHLDEVKEDENVAISMCNAIDLFYRNPKELIEKVYGVVEYTK